MQTAKRRLKRVLPAYLVWSVLYLAVDAVFGKPHAHPIKNILTGGSYVHLYYIFILVQLILLSELFCRAVERHPAVTLLLSAGLTFGMEIVLYLLTVGQLQWQFPVAPIGLFVCWPLFYNIGAWLAKSGLSNRLRLRVYLPLWALSAVLVLLFVYLYKQLRRVYRIKEELSQTNAKLARLNEELGEKNEQLSDSNAVKVQYIARFFDLCSMYIDKMDDYRKSLKKLAQDRKFDELNRRLKSTSMLEDEQDELYKNFDAIFLNLYPSFVEDFNALLTEDERIVLKQEDLLNKELRIYALLRLGITDSVKIASFLRCSLSTVYNYRTKVRNKAAISREEFEKMVMKIGTAHKTDV